MPATFQPTFIGIAVGTLVGSAAALLALGISSGRPAAELYAPAAVHVTNSALTAATMPHLAAAGRIPRPTLAQAMPAGVEQNTPAETPTTGASAAWMGLASVTGAVAGFFLAKKAAAPQYTALDVEEGLTRRQALATGIGAVTFGAALQAQPASAAYGDAANVFGKKKDTNQFFSVSGAGWSTVMPGKYNPSKEREFPGTVARWEDNFDSISCASVIVIPGVNSLGSIDDVRRKYVDPLLGQQSFIGDTISEGGFAPGRVSSAAILDQRIIEKQGKDYYEYELLTRTADGDEGGKHQLFSLAVSNGNLYILKHQAGDKRWFKGLEKPLRESIALFTVA